MNNRVHSSRQGFSTCQDASGAAGYNPPPGTVFEGLTVNHTAQGIWPCMPRQTAMNIDPELHDEEDQDDHGEPPSDLGRTRRRRRERSGLSADLVCRLGADPSLS